MNSLRAAVAAVAFAVCGTACEHVSGGVVVTATATPSAGTNGAVAGPCNAPDVTTANIVYVGMGSVYLAAVDAHFGPIAGFGLLTTSFAPTSTTAQVITVPVGTTLQFINVEFGTPDIVNHAAVGFPNATAFPAAPFTFPASADTVAGTQVSLQSLWSTGQVANIGPETVCASSDFAVQKAGTYYFGDLDFYNFAPVYSARDVIVAQ